MIGNRTFICGEEGSSETWTEEVSCKPNFSEIDILYGAFMLTIGRFAVEYDQRLENPSLYTDIGDIEVEKDTGGSPDVSIFDKQPEPLIVKNPSYLEVIKCGRQMLFRRIYDTKYHRVMNGEKINVKLNG